MHRSSVFIINVLNITIVLFVITAAASLRAAPLITLKKSKNMLLCSS